MHSIWTADKTDRRWIVSLSILVRRIWPTGNTDRRWVLSLSVPVYRIWPTDKTDRRWLYSPYLDHEPDVRSSKKREQQIRQQPEWYLLPSDRCLFSWEDSSTRKQHVENVSQMYDKNSWGFCQRSKQNKTRSAHPFEGATYWLGCSRSTLPCHLSERLHSRGWQTPGNHQRH